MTGDNNRERNEWSATSEQCFPEEIAAYAAGGLDPDEMEAIQVHLSECGECSLRLEQFWRNTTEQGFRADSEHWHDLHGAERILRKVIVLGLDTQGHVRFIKGPEPLQEPLLGTQLRSSSVDLSEVHRAIAGVSMSVNGTPTQPATRRLKWRLSDDDDPVIELTARVSESKKSVELQVSVQPLQPTRIELYDETDSLTTSAVLEDFSRHPLELPIGRWLLRLRFTDTEQVKVMPLELRELGA